MYVKKYVYQQNLCNNMVRLRSFWTNLRVLETPVHLVWALELLFGAVFDFSDGCRVRPPRVFLHNKEISLLHGVRSHGETLHFYCTEKPVTC